MRKFYPLLLLVAASCLNAEPPYGDPNQPYDKIPGTWETAHTPFLKPLAGGKLNALYLTRYHTAREVVEFAQRLDQSYTVIMNAGRDVWDQGTFEGGNATQLIGVHAKDVLRKIASERLALDRKYDLIVIGGISWMTIPEEYRRLILEHVKNGCGLLYVSPSTLQVRSYPGLNSPDPVKKLPPTEEYTNLFTTDHFPEVTEKLYASLPFQYLNMIRVKDQKGFDGLCGTIKGKHYLNKDIQSPFTVSTSSFGKGNIVVVQYYDADLLAQNVQAGLIPDAYYDQVAYDYYYALLAKCALWATGKEDGALSLKFMLPEMKDPPQISRKFDARHYWAKTEPPLAFNRGELAKGEIVFESAAKDGCAFSYKIRDAADGTVASGRAEGTKAAIPFPALPDGAYLIDLTLENAKREKLDFITKAFQIVADNSVAALGTERDVYAPGETINGTATFSRPLKDGENAAIEVRDTWKRLVLKAPLKLDPSRGGGAFSVAVDTPVSRLWDIACVIGDAKGQVASKSCWVSLPDWNFDDYPCAEMLGLEPVLDAKSIIGAASLRRFGVNAALSQIIWMSGAVAEDVVRRNYINVFYSAHLGEREVTNDHTKPSDGWYLSEKLDMVRRIADTGKELNPNDFPKSKNWMSAEWFNNQLKTVYIPSGKFASPFYVLNSENQLLGESNGMECSGFSDSDTKQFQTWCRKEYKGDLAALNKEWSTKFSSWDQVKGIMLNDAVEGNQLPRWVDFRYFMRSEVFSALHAEWGRMIRRFVPQAKTADCGHANFDYTKFGEDMTCKAAVKSSDLGSVDMEIHQSFSGDKGFILSEGNTLRWDNELQTPLDNARYVWKNFLLGGKGQKIGMEQYNSLGGCSYLTADYSEPLPFFQSIAKELGILRNGVSRLVANTTPYRSEAAILWAPRNHYISRLLPMHDNGFSGGDHYNVFVDGGAYEDALILMNSLRTRPTFIGPDDLGNEQTMRKYRALLLPYNVGMSEKEAEAIKAFVRNGGLVIASNDPATYTEHGRPLEKARLAELFPVTDKMNVVKYGEGHAVYLPDAINGYHKRLIQGDFSGSDSVAAALADYASIRSPVEITDEKGLPVRDILAPVFRDGPAEYLGLLRYGRDNIAPVQKIKIDLKKKCYVWETRERKYLGQHEALDIDLDLCPKLYALLPAKPEGIELAAKGKVGKGECLNVAGKVVFAGGAAADFQQVVNIKVYHGGKELEHYTKNILFSGGKFTFRIPVSHTEEAGMYKIVATDAATGLTAEETFEVVQ